MFRLLKEVPLKVWLWIISFVVSTLPIAIGFPGVTIFVWGGVTTHLFSRVLQRKEKNSESDC